MIPHRTRSYLLVLLIPIVFLSCKKNGIPPSEKQPPKINIDLEEEEELPKINAELSLSYLKSHEVSSSVFFLSSAAKGDYFFAAGNDPYPSRLKFDIYNGKNQQWTSVPITLERTTKTMAYLKGKVFVGGNSNNPEYKFNVDIYDMSTGNSSSLKLNSNTRLDPALSAVIDNRFLIFYESGFFHVYDDQENKWESIEINIKDLGEAEAMVSIGKKLYFNDFGDLKTIKVYDFYNRTWTKISHSNNPTNRKLMASDDQLYFYGNSFDSINEIHVYNTTNNTWSTITMPEELALYTMSIEKQTNTLVITGGFKVLLDVNNVKHRKPSDDIFSYHPGKKIWKQSKLKIERYKHTTQFINGQFIVHGGQSPLIIGNLPTEIYKISFEALKN